MFKKDEAGGETIIAAGVRVEGDFTSKGRVIIDGEVMGNVKTEDDIHIGEQAKIIANVHARNAIVAGEIKGNVRIKDRLDLTSTSKVKGDITASVLTMEAGAALSGKCSAGDVSIQKTKVVQKEEVKEETKEETPQE